VGLRGLVGSLVIGVIAAGLSVVVVDTPAGAAPSKQETITERPDSVSAAVTARAQGHRVEDLSQRTETTQVFANPDGSWTSEQAASPVRAKDEQGRWADIDLTLHKVDGGYAPASALGGLVIPAGGEKTFAQMTVDGRDLAWQWPGVLPEPTVVGDTATYADVVDGGDLVVTATASGFRHDIVLHQAPADPVAFHIPMVTTGPKLTEGKHGGLSVKTKSGAELVSAGPPVMYDAPDRVTGESAHRAPVDTTVTQTATGAVMTLDPDEGFLNDPDVTYPVTIDPTFNSTNPDDTWIYNTSPTAIHPGDATLYAGTPNAGSTKYRTFIRFNSNTEPWNGATVSSATLTLRNFDSSGTDCYGAAVEVRRVAGDWSPGSLNWNNQPSTSITYATSTTARKGGSTGCAAGDVSWNVTGIAQEWASWAANYGLQVRGSDETKTATYREYRSAGTYNPPFLTVTYNHLPATPSTPVVAGVAAYTAPGGVAENYVATSKPSFSSTISDADGNVTASFEVATSPGGSMVASCASGAVYKAGTGTCTLTSPLADGTYYVRVHSRDSDLAWSAYSGSVKFTVAQNKPAAPVVSCPDPYTDGSWTATGPGGTVTCTITATGSGTSAPGYINVAVDRGTPTHEVIAQSTDPGVAKTTAVVQLTDGGHGITATAQSPSGLTSEAAEYGFGFGDVGMTSPAADEVKTTTDTIGIDAAGPPSGVTGSSVTAVVKWRLAGSGGDWSTGWNLDSGSGSALKVTNDATGVHVSGVWDTRHAKTDNGTGGDPVELDKDRPYLLDVQVCIDYPGTEVAAHCTWPAGPRQVLRVAHAFGGAYPTADVPGGQVALWTGELAISDSDATVGAPGADLTLSRTAASLAGPASNPANKVFGPGWTASLDGPAAGLGDMSLIDSTPTDGTLMLVDTLGTTMVFGASQTPARRTGAAVTTGDWVPLDEDTELSGTVLHVSGTGAGTTVAVTEDDGTITTYTVQTAPAQPTSTSPGAAVFKVGSIDEAGTEGATTYSYDTTGRVTRMLAPVPAGVTCPATGSLPAGCRALQINYAPPTTPIPGTAGDYPNQVSSVQQIVGGATQTVTTLATYKYNSGGRLVSVTDPRNNLSTTYSYDGTSDRVASVTPAGLKPINYAYSTGTTPKLARVTRDYPNAGDGTATLATIVYQVPTSGHPGLPDLDQTSVDAWGQAVAPTYAAAVFGPDQPLSGAGTSVSADDVDNLVAAGDASWADADLSYTDDDGREINTAAYGAGAWQVTSTTYDSHDNVTRSLTESDIAAIKTGQLNKAQAGTEFDYNDEVKNGAQVVLAAGSVVTDTYGTPRPVLTRGGTTEWARPHTHTDYDQGAPNGGINAATGQRYALPTTSVVNAVTPDKTTVVESYSKTTTDYTDAIAGNPEAGWNQGLASTVTTDMTGSPGPTTTDIVARTFYDATGRVIETRQPKSSGADAGTRKTYYYTAAAHPSVAVCGNKAAWAGAVCRTEYAGTNATSITTTINSYDDLLNPLTTQETTASASRTTTNTYRPDGALLTTTVGTTGLTGSTVIGKTTQGYDPTTGLPTTVTTDPAGSNPGGTISTGYDTWGRQTTYTPAPGETTTTAYNKAGYVAAVTDPQGTTSYTYDGTDAAGNAEHRGLVTKLTVTRPSGGDLDITGAYDASGALTTQKFPGGVTREMSYDTAGLQTGLAYTGQVTTTDPDTGATNVDADGTWLGWTQANDGLGRVRRDWTPTGASFNGDTNGAAATGFSRDYTYDRAARLVTVKDQTVPIGNAGAGTTDPENTTAIEAITACQIRDYAFDANGNRTSLTRTTAAAATGCPPTAAGTVTANTWSYDGADKITNGQDGGSYVYDAFGRATTIPQGDTPAAAAGGTPGTVALSYYDDDSVKSMAQNGTTTTFSLDAAGRRSASTTTPSAGDSTTIARHYTDDSDNPGWTITTTGGGTPVTERYTEDLTGNLGLTITDTGASLAVVDLHGDQVSQIDLPTSGPATGIASWTDTDEYGNPLDTSTVGQTPTNTAGVADGLGYGWLGGKQRATDTTGLLLMGARVYNPSSGDFTSTDPVYGGNSTSYSYPQDPVNGYDVDGNCWRGFGMVCSAARTWTKHASGCADHRLGSCGKLFIDNVLDITTVTGVGGLARGVGRASYAFASKKVVVRDLTSGWRSGRELSLGKDARVSLGNKTATNPKARVPHYHRRVTGVDGRTVPGQGIGRHRPWDKKAVDKMFWDRF
jgi:RHS repeat-associated protein